MTTPWVTAKGYPFRVQPESEMALLAPVPHPMISLLTDLIVRPRQV